MIDASKGPGTGLDKMGFFARVKARFREIVAEHGPAYASGAVGAALSLMGPLGAPLAFYEAYYDVKRERQLAVDIQLSKAEIAAIVSELDLNTAWVEELRDKVPDLSARIENLEQRSAKMEGQLQAHGAVLEDLSIRVSRIETLQFANAATGARRVVTPGIDSTKGSKNLAVAVAIVSRVASLIERGNLGEAARGIEKGKVLLAEESGDGRTNRTILAYLDIHAGEIRYRQGDLNAAERHFREAGDHASRAESPALMAISLSGIGMALGKQGRLKEALESFTKAVETYPRLPDLWLNRGIALELMNQYEDALASYQEALRLARKNPSALYEKAVVLGKLGMIAEAIETYEELLRVEPGNLRAWINRGIALGALGRYDAALESVDRVLQSGSGNAEAWSAKAAILAEAKRHGDAVHSLDEAIKLDADSADVWYSRGVSLGELGRAEEALASFAKACDLDPKDPRFWNNKGCSLLQAGRHVEAIEAFDKALTINPSFARTWANRGFTQLALGLQEEANSSFAMSLSIEPREPVDRFNQGVIYGLTGRYEKAAEVFRGVRDVAARAGNSELERQAIHGLKISEHLSKRGDTR